jgi:hypothetical protein
MTPASSAERKGSLATAGDNIVAAAGATRVEARGGVAVVVVAGPDGVLDRWKRRLE